MQMSVMHRCLKTVSCSERRKKKHKNKMREKFQRRHENKHWNEQLNKLFSAIVLFQKFFIYFFSSDSN